MALVECPDCGSQISDGAASCPTCGFSEPERPPLEFSPFRFFLGALLLGVGLWLALVFIPEHDPNLYLQSLVRETDPSVEGVVKTVIQHEVDAASGRWMFDERWMPGLRLGAWVIAVLGLLVLALCRIRRRDLVDCESCDRLRIAKRHVVSARCLTCGSSKNAYTRRNRIAFLAVVGLVVLCCLPFVAAARERAEDQRKVEQGRNRREDRKHQAQQSAGRYRVVLVSAGVTKSSFARNDDHGLGGGGAPDLFFRVRRGGRSVERSKVKRNTFTLRGGKPFVVSYSPGDTFVIDLLDKDALHAEKLASWTVRSSTYKHGMPLHARLEAANGCWIEFSASRIN